MKKKWTKYLVRGALSFIFLWILLFAIAVIYIRIKREDIVASIRSDLNKKISGKISFDDLAIDLFQNFPEVSIDVKNVRVQDSSYVFHKKELLHVKHIYTGFGILELLSGKKNPRYLTLSDGAIFLFADSIGNKNWSILKTQTSAQQKINLKKITLKNINAFFQDDKKYKFFNLWFEKTKCNMKDKENQIIFEIRNKAIIKNASFNTQKGSYLTNKKFVSELNVIYTKSQKKISLKNQLVKLNKQSYYLTSDFFLGNDPHFNINIKTTNLSLAEAASIFPPRTAKRIDQFKLSKSLQKVEAFLSGPMKYRSLPLINVTFSVNDASLDISSTRFEHCSFAAFFKNEIDPLKPKDDSNSFLKFTNVRGEWEKNLFDSKDITFYNLVHPYIRCNVHAMFDLSQLEKAIASNMLDFNGGKGEANLNYAGPLETRVVTDYDLNGMISISNGDITYNPRNLNFKKTDIEIHFQKGNMLVKKMNTVVNDNHIRINGTVVDFLTFFNTDPSKAIFDWNVYSPSLDISKLTSSLRRKTSVKNKRGSSFFEKLNNKIDRLFDACNAYLFIKADKVTYKNFIASNVNGRLTMTNDMIKLDNFSLIHANGFIQLNASSKDNGNTSDLVLQSKMQDVNVKELFRSFNNFGLKSLTSENINGNFSADINLTSMLDANNNLYKPANKGWVDFSLKNGRLVNFKPLMEIDNNFLQKRNLREVSFAELKDRLDLNGNDIRVNRMEIRSTAVNMYIEGIYSFARNTNLSIQVPLKGQKKEQGKTPDNKGINAKTGISVFLRAKDDKDGKLKISYDLMGRFRNKNKG
ncbi:MAG TPA: AsmA-like C-terminal region-containing protein [Chitinophagaceae bacterium]|jgi:hypothetical protein|nr:AsmA-like C-terminal region-containing protein [Chitinophagaceae bacterium]